MQHINYFENPYSVKKLNNNVDTTKQKENKFTSVMDGFLIGNMEKGTYIPYKNYKPVLGNNFSAKDGLMMTIQAHELACTDLNLFLDLNPNDKEALALYRDYRSKLDEACKLYSEQYSPLMQDENVAGNTWEWLTPWPFERGES